MPFQINWKNPQNHTFVQRTAKESWKINANAFFNSLKQPWREKAWRDLEIILNNEKT